MLALLLCLMAIFSLFDGTRAQATSACCVVGEGGKECINTDTVDNCMVGKFFEGFKCADLDDSCQTFACCIINDDGPQENSCFDSNVITQFQCSASEGGTPLWIPGTCGDLDILTCAPPVVAVQDPIYEAPVSSSYNTLWAVLIILVLVGCCCCCFAFLGAGRRRRRDEDEEEEEEEEEKFIR